MHLESGSKRQFALKIKFDTNGLLHSYTALAILQTFGFADLLRKSLHPHVWAGTKVKCVFAQARTHLTFLPWYHIACRNVNTVSIT